MTEEERRKVMELLDDAIIRQEELILEHFPSQRYPGGFLALSVVQRLQKLKSSLSRDCIAP